MPTIYLNPYSVMRTASDTTFTFPSEANLCCVISRSYSVSNSSIEVMENGRYSGEKCCGEADVGLNRTVLSCSYSYSLFACSALRTVICLTWDVRGKRKVRGATTV